MATRSRSRLGLFLSSASWFGSFWIVAHAPDWAAGATNIWARSQDDKSGQDKPAAPPVKLVEGERVKAGDVVALMRSALLEEGDAVKKLSEANLKNVRYNIEDYSVGYAIASERVDDYTVFTGPIKGWRAKDVGEVSSWPPPIYPVTRREAMRQAKMIVPVPLAESVDEMNNLRVYYRPLLVGHDGKNYQEQPTALAFFIHPKTGTRMTALFREGRSYGFVDEPLVVHAKVFVQSVVPGRGKEGSSLVPSTFYAKDISIDAKPFPNDEKPDRLLQAVLAAHEKPPLATDDFKALFELMSHHTGGKTDPVATAKASQSTSTKRE